MSIYNYSNPSEYKTLKNLEKYQSSEVSINSIYYNQYNKNPKVSNNRTSLGNIIHYQGNNSIITSLQNLTYPNLEENDYEYHNMTLISIIDRIKLQINCDNTHNLFLYSKLLISPKEKKKIVIIGTSQKIYVVEITNPTKIDIIKTIDVSDYQKSSISVYQHFVYIFFENYSNFIVIDMRDSDEEITVFEDLAILEEIHSFEKIFIFPKEKYLFITQPNGEKGIKVYQLSDETIYPTYLHTWDLTYVNSIDLHNIDGKLQALITTKNNDISDEITLTLNLNLEKRQSLFIIDISDIYKWEVKCSSDSYDKAIMLDNALYLTDNYIIGFDNNRYPEFKMSGLLLFKIIYSDLYKRPHLQLLAEIDVFIPKICNLKVEHQKNNIYLHIYGYTYGYKLYQFMKEIDYKLIPISFYNTFSYYKDEQQIGTKYLDIIDSTQLLITDTLNGIFLISRKNMLNRPNTPKINHNLFPLEIKCDIYLKKIRTSFYSKILFYDSKMDVAILSIPDEKVTTTLHIGKPQKINYFDKIILGLVNKNFASSQYIQGYISSKPSQYYDLIQDKNSSIFLTKISEVMKFNTSLHTSLSGGVATNVHLKPVGLSSKSTKNSDEISLIPIEIISKIWNKYLKILFQERVKLQIPEISTIQDANIKNLLIKNIVNQEYIIYRNREMSFAHHTLLNIKDIIKNQIYKIYSVEDKIIFLGYVLIVNVDKKVWNECNTNKPDEYISKGYLVSKIYLELEKLHHNKTSISLKTNKTYILDRYESYNEVYKPFKKNIGSMLGISVCPFNNGLINLLGDIQEFNKFPETLYLALFKHFDLFSKENRGLLVLDINKKLNPGLDEYDIEKGDIIVSIEGKNEIEYTFPTEVYLTHNKDNKIRIERYRFEKEHQKWLKRTVFVPYVDYVLNSYYI